MLPSILPFYPPVLWMHPGIWCVFWVNRKKIFYSFLRLFGWMAMYRNRRATSSIRLCPILIHLYSFQLSFQRTRSSKREWPFGWRGGGMGKFIKMIVLWPFGYSFVIFCQLEKFCFFFFSCFTFGRFIFSLHSIKMFIYSFGWKAPRASFTSNMFTGVLPNAHLIIKIDIEISCWIGPAEF